MNRFFIGLLLMAVSFSLFGQDWKASKNTLLNFTLQSSAGILDRLDTYELTTEREKSLYNRYQDTLSARLARFALDPVYAELAAADITLEPKQALAEHLTYGKDGLPSILMPKRAIKRVGNKGYTTDYFFNIKISIEAHGMVTGVSKRVKPKVRCQIKVYDAAGEDIKNEEAEVLASDYIKSTEFPNLIFDKIGLDYIEMLQKRLEPLVLEAVEAAVEKL